MHQFLQAYERIKHIEFRYTTCINEVSKFSLEKQDVIQLREMSDIYSSTFSSSTAGVATGAVISLATNGTLPIVTGALSTAGTALMAGEVGVAAGLTGSAVSFGATMTPLAAIAAPVVLFTGISSSIKADENLEKAKATYTEAELAVEKMGTSQDICEAITTRTNMFRDLLQELNIPLSFCVMQLDGVTRKKMGIFRRKIKANTLTDNETKLAMVTFSLAASVKAILDTPMILEDGDLNPEFQNIYEDLKEEISIHMQSAKELEKVNFDANPVNLKVKPVKINDDSQNIITPKVTLRNMFALILAVVISCNIVRATSSTFNAIIAFTVTLLAVMDTSTKTEGVFSFIKKGADFSLATIFCVLFFKYTESFVTIKRFLLYDIIAIIITLILLGKLSSASSFKNLKKLGTQITTCTLLFEIGLLVFNALYNWINLSLKASMIISLILYGFLAFAIVDAIDDDESFN